MNGRAPDRCHRAVRTRDQLWEMWMSRPVRWLVLVGVVVGLSAAGGYRLRDRREAERLAAQLRELEEQRQTLQRVVERLCAERRVADIYVLAQQRDAGGHVRSTDLRFVEISGNGELISDRWFTVPGETIYFDGLVIKFNDDRIQHGDELRGHSIVLFQRVFSAEQAPVSGYPLDQPGEVPVAYRLSSAPNTFEQQLWTDFWALAKSPDDARQRGVRVAQGEAVYAPLRTGEHWQLSLEADGGLNLTLHAPAPADDKPIATVEPGTG